MYAWLIQRLSGLYLVFFLLTHITAIAQANLGIIKGFEAQESYPEKEFIQTPKDREAIDTAIDCIDCGACFSSCPLTWTDPKYPGPAAFVKSYRFIADTRDTGKSERLKAVGCEDGVWRCHTVFNCADSCPKSINPTNFIQQLKRKATKLSILQLRPPQSGQADR
jgi:succinate dehydrogenase / fumarate reductase iron-sulfur subunit